MAMRDRRAWLVAGIALCLAVATVNFARDLSSQSLFVDDAYSWNAARYGGSALIHQVREVEVAPPTYYAMLHVWMYGFAGQSEAALRVLSVFAGVLLVLAVALLAGILGGPRAAVLAAGITALSPLVIQYSQQARAYIFAALACTVAVAAAVRAGRDGARRWIVAATVASIIGVWFHYTALLVIAPTLGWLVMRPAVPVRWRIALLLAVAAFLAPLIPIAEYQIAKGHAGVAAFAAFSLDNLASVAAGPFFGRLTAIWPAYLGAFVAGAALLALLRLPGRAVEARSLIVTVCLVPIAAVVAITLVAENVLISRYTAVVAPIIIAAVAVVIARGPRVVSAVVGTAALVLCVAGTLMSHQRSSFPAPVRPAVAFIVAHARSTDVIVDTTNHGVGTTVYYYLVRDQRTGLGIIGSDQITRFADAGHRLWLLSPAFAMSRYVVSEFRRVGLRIEAHQSFTSGQPLSVTLASHLGSAR